MVTANLSHKIYLPTWECGRLTNVRVKALCAGPMALSTLASGRITNAKAVVT